MTLCRKHPHRNPRDAARQARSLRRAPYYTGQPLTVYRCPVCGWWHITSKKQRP